MNPYPTSDKSKNKIKKIRYSSGMNADMLVRLYGRLVQNQMDCCEEGFMQHKKYPEKDGQEKNRKNDGEREQRTLNGLTLRWN